MNKFLALFFYLFFFYLFFLFFTSISKLKTLLFLDHIAILISILFLFLIIDVTLRLKWIKCYGISSSFLKCILGLFHCFKFILTNKSTHHFHHFELVRVLVFALEPLSWQINMLYKVRLNSEMFLIRHSLEHYQLIVNFYC